MRYVLTMTGNKDKLVVCALEEPSWEETARLEALRRTYILETTRSKAFDEIVEMASDLLDAPIAVINFIGADRQWFKAEVGIGQDELPLDVSICRFAILQPGVFVVPDLSADPRFDGNPLVHSAGGLRFYAGALLETAEGLPLGTVCVLDTKARPEGITDRQRRMLTHLASQTMTLLDCHLAARRFEQRKHELESLIDDAPLGIVYFDSEHRYIHINDELAEINGIAAADHIGKRIEELLPINAKAVGPILDEVFATGRATREVEVVGDTPREPGVMRQWLTSYFPVTDDDGCVTAVGAWVLEITERKRAEAELEALNIKLETRVAERTRALESEIEQREQLQHQLFQTQKLEALGQMTSGFAHDFNNMIQAVSAGFALISKWSDDPRIHDVARQSVEAALRGSNLIKQMLAFARNQPLELTSLSLPAFLDRTLPMLQRAAPQVRITINCPNALPDVRTDDTQLEAALINFAVNARDAMPAESGEITICVSPCPFGSDGHLSELDERDAVAISFSDNGSGMTPEIKARVTEPFFTTKGIGKGTGLGLASVSGFASQSGGALRIKSAPGRGTTIMLYLPTAVQGASDIRPAPDRDSSELRRILLVDDDAIVRSIAAIQLREFGYEVVEASNGVEAMGHANQLDSFAGVVSDVAMPDCDGPTMAAELRKLRPTLPILFITGFAKNGSLAGERVLRKPFTPEELSAAVGSMIEA